jgi:hypothetical protein
MFLIDLVQRSGKKKLCFQFLCMQFQVHLKQISLNVEIFLIAVRIHKTAFTSTHTPVRPTSNLMTLDMPI